MTKPNHMKVMTTLLAALLAVLLLTPVASAEEEVEPKALPGSNGAIAFVSAQEPTTNRFQVFRMNSDGFGQTRLSDTPGHNWDPTWSPDGTQLVLNSNRSGDYEVYRMKAAPEGRLNRPINFSKNPADDTGPTWSPDGRKIAFNSDRPSRDGTTDLEIWRMRASDGANPTNLTDNAVFDFDPEWQPVP